MWRPKPKVENRSQTRQPQAIIWKHSNAARHGTPLLCWTQRNPTQPKTTQRNPKQRTSQPRVGRHLPCSRTLGIFDRHVHGRIPDALVYQASPPDLVQLVRRQPAVDPGPVDPVDLGRREFHLPGKAAVVGHQYQSLGGHVQPSDRLEVGLCLSLSLSLSLSLGLADPALPEAVHEGRPAVGIVLGDHFSL